MSSTRFNLALRGESEFVDGLWASGTMFEVLGVRAMLGRTFGPQDDQPGGGPDGPVAVISDGFWHRRFGGAADVIGRSITVERVPFTIVGVAPPGFFGVDVGRTFDVAIPIGTVTRLSGARALQRRSSWWLRIMFRLKPGQTVEGATAMLRARQPAMRAATMPDDWHADEEKNYLREPFRVEPAPNGDSSLRERYSRPLTTIMVVVGLVLLVTCANLANLLLARGSARRHELSLRVALGASRLRIARQLLTESLLLSSAGALLGLLVARLGSRALATQLTSEAETVFLDLALDWRVLGFTAAAAVGTALLFGTAPAVRATRVQPNEALKTQGRGAGAGGLGRLGHALIVLQVALSLVLLVAAGLFLRTFASLARLHLGFDSQPMLVASIEVPEARIEPADREALFRGVIDAALAVPGVSGAALSTVTPVSRRRWNNRIELPDGPPLPVADRLTSFNMVSPGWFRTYGMRLIAGRDFASTDTPGALPVAIVNEAFARRFTGGRNPIGTRVHGPHDVTRVIVGYVNDAVYDSLREPVPPTLYMSVLAGAPARRLNVAQRASGRGFAGTPRKAARRGAGAAPSRPADYFHPAGRSDPHGADAGTPGGGVVGLLRPGGAAAGVPGPVWRHVVRREPAARGDRHPDRARRRTSRRRHAGPRTRAAPRRTRPVVRHRREPLGDAVRRAVAFRPGGAGPADADRRGPPAHDDGRARRLAAGAPGVPHRSGPGTEPRIDQPRIDSDKISRGQI